MARAQGARAQMALAFETIYGTPPVGGFTKMPWCSDPLGCVTFIVGESFVRGKPAHQKVGKKCGSDPATCGLLVVDQGTFADDEVA